MDRAKLLASLTRSVTLAEAVGFSLIAFKMCQWLNVSAMVAGVCTIVISAIAFAVAQLVLGRKEPDAKGSTTKSGSAV